jgi:hypothetical protein
MNHPAQYPPEVFLTEHDFLFVGAALINPCGFHELMGARRFRQFLHIGTLDDLSEEKTEIMQTIDYFDREFSAPQFEASDVIRERAMSLNELCVVEA